jgi:hypothetical protein
MFLFGLIVGIVLMIVVIVGFALFGGRVAGEQVGFDELEHEHDYQIVGASQMFNVRTIRGIQIQRTEEGEPITEVLYRCNVLGLRNGRGCGEVYTDTLTGHWTLEQLTGKPKKPAYTPTPILLDQNREELLKILGQANVGYIQAIKRGREMAYAAGSDGSLLTVKTYIDELKLKGRPGVEFCGFESLHEAHEYDGKQCPGSAHLTENTNASGGRSNAMAGGDNSDAAKSDSGN